MPFARPQARPTVGAPACRQDQDFERVVLALHDAALDDAAWPRASALIDDACATHSNHLFAVDSRDVDGPRHLFGSRRAHGAPLEALAREYAEDFFPIDERMPRLLRLPAGSLIRNSDLYTASEQRASLTCNDFPPRHGAAQGGADQICVRLQGLDGRRIFRAATRLAAQGAWRTAHVNVLRRLPPHVRGLARTRQALAKADALAAALTAVLNAPATGALSLDRAGHVVRANDRAGELLADNRALSLRDGVLHAARSEDAERLARLVAHAAGGARRAASARRDGFGPRRHHALDHRSGRHRTSRLRCPARGRGIVDHDRPRLPALRQRGSPAAPAPSHQEASSWAIAARPGPR